MTKEEERTLTTEDLENLLRRKVSKIKTTELTATGDNYGSTMLAVDVTLESGSDVALVAKMFHTNEFTHNMFQSPISMKKEIGVYQIISPEYERIQEENNVPPSQRLHVFCDCPGARLTLNDNDEDQLADVNSVLLLENLKVKGYRTGDRVSGVDMKHTEFVMERLAKFHATAVAIKLKKPLVFRNKIVNVLTPFKMNFGTKEEADKRNEDFLNSLQSIPACNRNNEAMRELFKKGTEFAYSNELQPISEPFATFMHNDFWTNNMMFKYKSETDEDPIDFKIVDFQVSQYGTPVTDILLFLFTSTNTGLVSEHIDRFLELYHRVFVEWLEILGCDTKIFSYEVFLKEVKRVAPWSLIHIVFMLMPITFNKEQVEKFSKEPPKEGQPPEFNDVYILKISETLDTYAEKGWI